MSTHPLYYIHHAAPGSDDWSSASTYRLNANHVLRVLGYYSGERTLAELALEIIGELTPLPANDSQRWNAEHQEEGRSVHARFYPATQRIQPGIVVNGALPWLSCTVDDLTWSNEGQGLVCYKAPYSKMLYQAPLPAQELQLCYLAGVTEWTRPLIDYVVWTPSGSAIKRYTPTTILVSRVELTLRQLWDNYLWPRLEHFNTTVLLPLLANRNLDPVKIYDCTASNYVAVRTPNLTHDGLISRVAER